MLTLPSFCWLIVHFHLYLVSNVDRLEMCKLLADTWFQTCFVLKVPFCCAQMTELWVVRNIFFFSPRVLTVQCWSNLVSVKKGVSCPLVPPAWGKKPCRFGPAGQNMKAGFRHCFNVSPIATGWGVHPVKGKSLHSNQCMVVMFQAHDHRTRLQHSTITKQSERNVVRNWIGELSFDCTCHLNRAESGSEPLAPL